MHRLPPAMGTQGRLGDSLVLDALKDATDLFPHISLLGLDLDENNLIGVKKYDIHAVTADQRVLESYGGNWVMTR